MDTKNDTNYLLTKPACKSVAGVPSNEALYYYKVILITDKMIFVLQDDLNAKVCEGRPHSQTRCTHFRMQQLKETF